MLRRHEAPTGAGSSRSRPRGACAWPLLLAVACITVTSASSADALAAPHEPRSAPEKLWVTFPLNPTGERLDRAAGPTTTKPGSLEPARPSRPSAASPSSLPRQRGAEGGSIEAVPRVEEVPSAAPADLVLVTLLVVAVFSVLTILAYAGLRSVRALYVSSHPPGHTFPWPNDPAALRAALGTGARRSRVRTNRPRSGADADVRVAVVGGTGALQTVFAKRLRKAGYRVVIGSRDEAGTAGLAAPVDDSNTEAAESADYVLYILD